MDTHPHADPRLPALRDEARAIAALLATAAGLLDAGRALDIGGLDQRVGRLCAQTLDLPASDGVALRPELVTLRDELDQLAGRMRGAA